jgi:serine protease Do
LAAAVSSTAEAGSQQRETPIVLAVRRAKPAVVNISSEKTVHGRSAWDNALSESQRVNGMGSGVVIDERGYIVTNAHVVDRVTTLRVKLADGTAVDATTIAIDRPTDLALIKINVDRPLATIPLGTSSDLMIGETVIAIGNAYGYENTTTGGFISALGRTVRLNEEMTYYDLIQTDASINPGNSGGALINIDGELIGVNVAIRAGASGISFAIPVNTVRRVAAKLLANANPTWHGLQYDERDSDGSSTLVVQKSDGPSQKCGLRAGDQIVRINDRPIHNGLEFERSMLGVKSGERTPIVIRRGASEERLELTIEDLPKIAESPTELVWRRLGVRLSATEAYQIQRFQSHLRGGMYVAQVQASSPAALAGIKPGDFLLGLHKWETLNYDNVVYVLSKHDEVPLDPITAHVLRSGEAYELQLRIGTATKDAAKDSGTRRR